MKIAWPGLMPQVTVGAMSAASMTTTVVVVRAGVAGEGAPAATAASQSAPFGA
jgi:hypothetical protein